MTTSKSVNKISPSDGKSQIWTFLSAHHSLYTGLNNAIRIVIKHSHAGWQVADIQLTIKVYSDHLRYCLTSLMRLKQYKMYQAGNLLS